MAPSGRPKPEPESPLMAMGSAEAPTLRLVDASVVARWRELDGQRAIAVIGVVVFHVYQFCNVDHFLYRGTAAYTVLNSLDAMIPWLFALSAFLLFEPIARAAINGEQAPSMRGFVTRRAIRIVPLYYVAVVIVWFSRQLTLPGDWRDLLEHLTFTQVFDEKRIFYTNGPAWAISVGVIFCLGLAALAPGLGWICRRLAGRRWRITVLAAVTVALGLISLAWKAAAFAIAHRSTLGSFTTWFSPLAYLDTFAVGMAVAVIVASLGNVRTPRPRIRLLGRAAGVGILVAAFATRQANTWTAVYFFTACAIGFGLLIGAAVLGPPDRWSRALSRRPLLWLAAASYSTYVWHEPILLALREHNGLVQQTPGDFPMAAVLVVIVSILLGWLSYLLIEQPTRQLGAMFGRDGHVVPSGRHTARLGNPSS